MQNLFEKKRWDVSLLFLGRLTVRRLTWFGLMLFVVMGWAHAAAAAPTLDIGASTQKSAQQSGQKKGESNNVAPDYAALAAMLEDPKSRSVIIKELQKLADQSSRGLPSGVSSSHANAEVKKSQSSPSLAGEMALDTLAFFHAVHEAGIKALIQFNRLIHVQPSTWDWSVVGAHLWRLALVVGFAYGVWLAFGRLIRPVLARLNRWTSAASKRRHLLRLTLSIVTIAAVGLIMLGVIFTGGNLLSAAVAGDMTSALWRQALFLNAFIVIEFARMVIGLMLTPSFEGLRLFRIKSEHARFWMRRSSRLIRFMGYGVLWLVPLVKRDFGGDAAQVLLWSLAIIGSVYVLYIVFRQRDVMRHSLQGIAQRQRSALMAWWLNRLAQIWHLLVSAYIGIVLVVGMTRPDDALPFIIHATGYTALIIAGALLLLAIIEQLFGKEIRLKDHHRQKVPLLEKRLNTYLPWLVRAVRLSLIVIATAMVLSVWHVTDVFAWLSTSAGLRFLSTVFDVIFILIATLVAWLLIASLIEIKLNGAADHIPSTRMQTLLTLFGNVVAIALLTVAVMMVLSEMGVNIGPLLAGAGVFGLAVGFGAQKLVQDVITGIFIQIENAINIGDTVTLGGITGTAERLSVRSVGLRDLNGTYHIVPFSSVGVVSNYMRGFAFHMAAYGIAYRENIDEAIKQLEAAFDELKEDPNLKGKILEPIKIPGVTELGASSVNIRVQIKTTPGDQWAVGRAYNRLVKIYFDAAGIEIPFPHTTIYFGEDKSGKAPPVYVRQLSNGNDK